MPAGDTRWTDAAWRAAADAWIEARLTALGLTRTAAFDQLHVRPWATVIRVPTTGGDVWFKANAPELLHEAALVVALSERMPRLVLPPLAADVERGWLLMADAGERLREIVAAERRLDRWLDVLPLYAELQVAMMGEAERLVALGTRDLRTGSLPALFDALLDEVSLPATEETQLRGSLPLVERLSAELLAFGIPDSVQHDDLHDGQVFVKDGAYLVLDWGDACVTHPFFTMAVTLDGCIGWGVDDVEGSEDTTPYRDAYLRPFVEAGCTGDLAAACDVARRLGWICRAVNGHLGGEEPPSAMLARLRMFLGGGV